jgi:hypothetical protein
MDRRRWGAQGSRRRLAVMLVVCGLLLAGCGRGEADLADVGVDLAVEPWPPRMGPAAVTVTLTDAGGQAIGGARVALEGNMHHELPDGRSLERSVDVPGVDTPHGGGTMP